MTPLDALAILAAGVAAGTINAIVGSGTLITFPVLISLGWAPVTANVSNNIRLVPGALTGHIGYRRELSGLALPQDLQRSNALKNLLSLIVNLVAGVIFVFAARVDWAVVALIAAGSIVGGYLGARYGRRLSQPRLRALIVVVGLTAIVR